MPYQEVPDVEYGYAWPAEYNDDYVKGNMDLTPAAVVTAKGDLFLGTGSQAGTKLAVGSDTQMLESRSTEATGRKWVSSGLAPVGGILIWSGAIVDIPDNWQLCDGTNGTPNLRNRFIVGSGSTYTSGDTGGAATINLNHSHTLTSPTGSGGSHTHTQADTGTEANHNHNVSGAIPVSTLHGYSDHITENWSKVGHTHTYTAFDTGNSGSHAHTNPTTGSGGSHTHAISNPGTNSQLSAAQSLMPAYYALAFIMRMA